MSRASEIGLIDLLPDCPHVFERNVGAVDLAHILNGRHFCIKLFCKIRIKFNIFGIHNNNSLLPFKNKIKQFELPAVDFFLTLLYYTKVEEL